MSRSAVVRCARVLQKARDDYFPSHIVLSLQLHAAILELRSDLLSYYIQKNVFAMIFYVFETKMTRNDTCEVEL